MGLLCLSQRALQQTTCLQHQPQPNLQTLFRHCSLPPGRVLRLRLPLLLLNQLKSTCPLSSGSVCLYQCYKSRQAIGLDFLSVYISRAKTLRSEFLYSDAESRHGSDVVKVKTF